MVNIDEVTTMLRIFAYNYIKAVNISLPYPILHLF